MLKIQMISNVENNNNANASNKNIIFSARRSSFARNNSVIIPSQAPPVHLVKAPEEKPKMKWGAPTWFLLHTIAEKMKDEYFLQFREDVLDVIYTICTNLPCPECSDHAKKYLSNTVRYKTIRSREELKNMLFNFHNYVNSRKGYPIFTREELDNKYNLANIKNIIDNFIIAYQDKSKSVKLLATELHRSRVIARLKEWFKNNVYLFLKDTTVPTHQFIG